MQFWIYLAGFMALVWVLDSLRLRKHARSLKVLEDGIDEPAEQLHFITRSGAALDQRSRVAAAAWLEDQKLDVLLLLPGDIKASEALVCCQTLNPVSFRTDRIAKARISGEAILVRSSVLERFGQDFTAPRSAVEFARLTQEFKKYSTTTMDLAVVPWLPASARHWREQGPLLDFVFGGIAAPLMILQMALVVAGVFFIPGTGIAAFLAWHLQPLISLAGTPLRSRGLFPFSLLRLFHDTGAILSSGSTQKKALALKIESKRAQYQELLAEGTDRFFETARPDCPICGGKNLSTAVSSRDMVQFKPGIFKIAQCQSCQHLFQNPRLSIDGLNFYYKDFYDGLGADQVDAMFSHTSKPYLARAGMLKGTQKPRRWLDVGAGHGHFCCVARDVWPGVPFDGLDLSQSVLDAHKRGWVDRAYHGLFPELADGLATEGAYDVISMSHYLEHTRDPESEIAAASKILPRGGHLLIELPDPDCRFGKWFGSFWLPWFQPQHQHMLSVRNLDRLLRNHSFEALTWHRGEAHQPIDLLLATGLVLNRIAPSADAPWLKPASFLPRIWHRAVFLICFPVLILARILDKVLAPAFRRPGWSNTYRVLARRTA